MSSQTPFQSANGSCPADDGFFAREGIRRYIESARAGSPEALGRLMEISRQYLLLVANEEVRGDLRAKGGASDLVQETFLEAQRDFVGFRGDNERELLAWLRQILMHNVQNFARQYRDTDKRQILREVSYATDDPSSGHGNPNVPMVDETPSGHAVASEERKQLERALGRLPVHYARVIELRHQEGRSFAEIGKIMNRSPEAVRKLWSRAIELLQTELEAESSGSQ